MASATSREGAETVLVIEDSEDIREMIREILEVDGLRVLTAADGEEALRLFEREGHRTDLLLCDVSLPGLSGPDVAQRLLQLRPGLPLIFVSGHLDAQEQCVRKVAAPFDFIEKPFDPQVLLRLVREMLSAERWP